jgi:hypothetical protein
MVTSAFWSRRLALAAVFGPAAEPPITTIRLCSGMGLSSYLNVISELSYIRNFWQVFFADFMGAAGTACSHF